VPHQSYYPVTKLVIATGDVALVRLQRRVQYFRATWGLAVTIGVNFAIGMFPGINNTIAAAISLASVAPFLGGYSILIYAMMGSVVDYDGATEDPAAGQHIFLYSPSANKRAIDRIKRENCSPPLLGTYLPSPTSNPSTLSTAPCY
jgi:hypothetical protein